MVNSPRLLRALTRIRSKSLQPVQCTTRATHSYAHGASSSPLLYETIGHRFRAAVEAVPDKELYLFDHQGIRKSYAEAYKDARQLACALLELGLAPGDRVGIWGPNYYEWVTCQMATAIGGFVQVNVNPSYHSDELRYALEKVGVRALITPRAFKKSNYYRTLQEIIPNLISAKPGAGHIKSRALPELEHFIVFGETEKLKGCWSYDELLTGVGSTSVNRLKVIEDAIRVDDPGTTGYPKAATLTHHNLLNNSYFQGVRSEYHLGDHSICIPNPLYHCFGSAMGVLNAIIHRQSTVFPDAAFNPLKTLEVVSREKCTSLYGTPTMFIDMLNHVEGAKKNGLDFSKLNAGYMCGAPCPIALCERVVNELGMQNLIILYGSTELSPVVTMSKLDEETAVRFKHVGYPLDHVELMVVDAEGQVVPRGTEGELLARGYNTMRGYYNDEERTKKEIDSAKWYHTGDTAVMNEDTTVSIVGRSKEMIIRGGENIYPTEIEQFLFKIPGVADAQVIGVPDERLGEAVCAWIRLREGATGVTPESITEACKGKMAHYKIPKYILIKNEKDFPLTVTGKVRKTVLRKISKQELGLGQVRSHFNDVTSS